MDNKEAMQETRVRARQGREEKGERRGKGHMLLSASHYFHQLYIHKCTSIAGTDKHCPNTPLIITVLLNLRGSKKKKCNAGEKKSVHNRPVTTHASL